MKLLILTEKPSVAKSFAHALNCQFSPKTKTYLNEKDGYEVINCVGHLYNLSEPESYDEKFKSWKNLPVIPETFTYEVNASVRDAAKLVTSKLKEYRNDDILIATDADREGEIIARECLSKAGIKDRSRIRRFWESQALTDEVIQNGIKNAKSLSEYDVLSKQGFARQRADWLCGMNFTRYLATREDKTFRVGRVQTALLAAIEKRCDEIKNFQSEKYYEAEVILKDLDGHTCRALYEDCYGNRRFTSKGVFEPLISKKGKRVSLEDLKSEEKKNYPDELFSLPGLQKAAFRCFGFSASKTLQIAQKLYEEYKCISYPRTPSSVMGSDNVELCKSIFDTLIKSYPEYNGLWGRVNISKDNRRCFDDSRLEAHHAIIPLSVLPHNATIDEENLFNLVLERFLLAFCEPERYEKKCLSFEAEGLVMKAEGRKLIDRGWKDHIRFLERFEKNEELEDLSELDFTSVVIDDVRILEKKTKAPKFFNEGAVIAFMENPSGKENDGKKLTGLGTPATRHTFIPKLIKNGCIECDSKKNLQITQSGRKLLAAVRRSKFEGIADISRTSLWECELEKEPDKFLNEIREFVRSSVSSPSL